MYEVERINVVNNLSKLYPNTDSYEYTELTFQFQHFMFQTIKREELYTDLDFASNIGGLLSLFIGTSFLSIIEVIFFFSIRFFKHLAHNTNHTNIRQKPLHTIETTSDDESNKQLGDFSTGPHLAWN